MNKDYILIDSDGKIVSIYFCKKDNIVKQDGYEIIEIKNKIDLNKIKESSSAYIYNKDKKEFLYDVTKIQDLVSFKK